MERSSTPLYNSCEQNAIVIFGGPNTFERDPSPPAWPRVSGAAIYSVTETAETAKFARGLRAGARGK